MDRGGSSGISQIRRYREEALALQSPIVPRASPLRPLLHILVVQCRQILARCLEVRVPQQVLEREHVHPVPQVLDSGGVSEPV